MSFGALVRISPEGYLQSQKPYSYDFAPRVRNNFLNNYLLRKLIPRKKAKNNWGSDERHWLFVSIYLKFRIILKAFRGFFSSSISYLSRLICLWKQFKNVVNITCNISSKHERSGEQVFARREKVRKWWISSSNVKGIKVGVS